MGRELKRVPVDFDYPIGQIWRGYCPDIENFQKLFGEKYPFLLTYSDTAHICQRCGINAGKCSESAEYCFWYNPENREKWHREIPTGDGYQLWETSTEGSSASPVFSTLDELCEWCADNATTFADYTATKEQWREMFTDNFVHHTEGRITFI